MSERLEAIEVARRLLHDPQFRYDVEAAIEADRGARPAREKRLEHARSMFEIGDRDGWVWIWINGLNTYGEGDSFAEAYHDTLDEIGHALRELWQARNTAGTGDPNQEDA